jgi:hypothetical protein
MKHLFLMMLMFVVACGGSDIIHTECDGGIAQQVDAGIEVMPTVYVSYSITNQDTVQKFCDFSMLTPTNPIGSGAYYYYELESGQSYGGYHVNGGESPFPVTFYVACWPDRNTPQDQRHYTTWTFKLTNSMKFQFENTTHGVRFVGGEQTP